MIDLLIPGQTPGIKEQLVDLYGKPELLFFGPDGTYRLFLLNHI
jgi:glutamate dehydrogenase